MVKRRIIIGLFSLVLATSCLSGEVSAQGICRVMDPTGTPLNVRTSPNGNAVGTLDNGVKVIILDRASYGGENWVYLGRAEDRVPIGWVFRNYLDCQTAEDTDTSVSAQRLLSAQASPYVVDGLSLGTRFQSDNPAYQRYQCGPSDKFPGFTWCHEDHTTKQQGEEITRSHSILEDQNGTAWYVNSYFEPAFFGANDVQNEINRLSGKFGNQPHLIQMPQREGLPKAIMAVWGGIELKQLSSDEVSTVAKGGSVAGLCVSFLGDLQRSAKAGVPVYRLAGAAGFLWVATFDQNGRGVLRFLTADASKFMPSITHSTPSASSGNQQATPIPAPTVELNAEDQSRIYGELTKLREQFRTIPSDQSLTTLQRTTELQAINARQSQLAMRADTQVNGWQCIVTDVAHADTHFTPNLAGMNWIVKCKFEDLTFGLWSRSDTQLIDIRKGSVVHFDARTICLTENCGRFATDFALQNIRSERVVEPDENAPLSAGGGTAQNQENEKHQENEKRDSNTIFVPLESEGGTYVVPVLINNAITLNFVVDSGATDVSIPADVVMTLVRTGTLKGDDFIGNQTYALADGSTVPSATFRIKSLTVGNKAVENVTAGIAPVQGTLLLGQSFLNRFSSWSIDNTKHALVLK
jgi:hypothetical protein